MPQLSIFKLGTLTALKESSTLKLEVYKSAPTFPEPSADSLFLTPIEIGDEVPVLDPDDEAGSAEKIHRFLPTLAPRQAADERLWATLTHGLFWEYTRSRWPDFSKQGNVLDHWFVAGKGLAALRRNAISRLWWAAHLTCAPWENNPKLAPFKNADRYFYTKILLRSQQIFQDTLEREYGSNTIIRLSLLHALHTSGKGAPPDSLTKEVVKRLQLLLQHRRLDILPPEHVLAQCEAIAQGASAGHP